jgi:hypothetical protein
LGTSILIKPTAFPERIERGNTTHLKPKPNYVVTQKFLGKDVLFGEIPEQQSRV